MTVTWLAGVAGLHVPRCQLLSSLEGLTCEDACWKLACIGIFMAQLLDATTMVNQLLL